VVGGLPVPALLRVYGAQVVHRACLADLVADLPVHGQRLPHVVGGLLSVTLARGDDAQVVQRPGLTRNVADLAVQVQHPPQVVSPLKVASLPQFDHGQVVLGLGFGAPVTGPPGSLAGVGVQCNGLGVVATFVQIAEYGRRQAGGVARPVVPGRVRSHADQGGLLAVQPRPRAAGIRHRRQAGHRTARRRPAMTLGREQHVHRGRGRAQVVVEQAGQRRLLLLAAVLIRGQRPGVGSQQVMQAVTARPGVPDQVRPH
jgi:hypothetical protein